MLTGKMRRNPHVQSYVVATDQVRVVGGVVGGWEGVCVWKWCARCCIETVQVLVYN